MRSTATLQPLVARYLAERKAQLAPSTQVRYRYNLRHFADSFGQRPLEQLGPAALDRWEHDMRSWAPNTRRVAWCHVHRFLTWLQGQGLLQRHPMADRRPPKVPSPVPATVPAETIRTIIAIAEPRTAALVAMAYGAGLTRAELVRVQVEDFDPIARTLTVHPTAKTRPGTVLPLSAQHADAIAAYLRAHPARAGEPLVRRVDGRPLGPDRAYQLVRHALEEAGGKIAPWDGRSVHGLRRSGASDLADQEPDLRLVASWLRHSGYSSLRHYVRHTDLGRMRRAVEARDESA